MYLRSYFLYYLLTAFVVEYEFTKGIFVGLAPKSYKVWRSDGEEKRSSKGIPHSIPLDIAKYQNILLKDDTHRVSIPHLRLSKEKKMMSAVLKKRGLSDIHIKMRVHDDKVTCTPLQNQDGTFL